MAGIDGAGDASAARLPELTPAERVEQKLIACGVPEEQLREDHQEGLLMYLEEHADKISEVTAAILSAGTDISEARKSSKKDEDSSGGSDSDAYSESLSWLQWMMFRNEPDAVLDDMEHSSAGERAVCGSVWGQNDLAYRCRTCENDSTCAICVPCFQNGNHEDHDYSIMYTGGGCCDCGDATAWKREGFCSRHKGAEQIKPLSEELASSVGPVLDELLLFWKERICLVEAPTRKADEGTPCKSVAEELTTSIADMLLRFCTSSESLLSFVSQRIRQSPDLLDALTRAERLLDKEVLKNLHELLLKLITEPAFKYDFAKVFIQYYPGTFSQVIKGNNDNLLDEYRLIPTFSVQIFTVPTLTARLVREHNLLGILLECLTVLFLSCVGEDAHLQTSKWGNLYDSSLRLLEDTRYVVSHEEVSKYVAYERPDLTRSWIKLLSLVQGMDPQKRVTSIHVEDENENLASPFMLGHYLGIIQNLLMKGAFSSPGQQESTDVTVCSTAIKGMENAENQRHAKVGRVSQENLVCNSSTRESSSSSELPEPATCLIRQCLKAIESWLEPGPRRRKLSSLDASSTDARNFLALLEDTLTINKGGSSKQIGDVGMKVNEGSQIDDAADYHEVVGSPAQESDDMMLIDQVGSPQAGNDAGKGKMNGSSNGLDVQLHSENAISVALTDGSLLYAHPDSRIDELGILNMTSWPRVVFDVGSQETSFHIPLHRMLSLLLRKAMKKCFGEDAKPEECSVVQSKEFFSQVLGGFKPYGFASIVMEHPLRVRVFCAQVRAGMWRKNGDAAILSAEWYRSVQWLEQGLESDLFLLQCCAALSSPEFFVKTIQERFGLSNYISLVLTEQNEYEPVLMQEMLVFLIQLVKERRFIGRSTADNLKRELIYKLAVGDATHSQIVKSLPRDLSSSDQLQSVLDSLAVYSNPSGMKQGKYVLRKAFWKELDLYHPRWNSREIQIAEERYYRFCKVSALNAQLPQWTHVFSPLRSISKIATSKAVLQIVRAVLFYAVYTEASSVSRAPDNVLVMGLHLLSLALDICESESQMYADKYGMDIVQHDAESWVVLSSYAEETFPILTYSTESVSPESDKVKNESMLTLLVSLMRKYNEENDNTFSGSKYCNVPSLVESLLKRFAKLSKQCMSALRQMAPQVVPSIPDHGSTKQNSGSPDLMDKKAKARQRQAAIMAKMKAEQSKFAESMKASENEGHPDATFEPDASSSTAVASEESRPVCSLCRDSDSKSPLCYLILLQKSRLATFVETGNPSWDNLSQSKKTSGSIRREKSTDSSGAGSSSSEELVRDTPIEPSFELDSMEVDAFLDFSNEQHPLIRYISCFPSGRCTGNADDNISLETIEADVYKSIVNDLAGIQGGEQSLSTSNLTAGSKTSTSPKSSVLGTYVTCLSTKYRLSSFCDVASKSSAPVTIRNRFGPVDCDGIHISSCGHAVHQECHDRYLFSLKQRYIRRLGFEGGQIVDPDLGELLCPVCRRFANSILPASPDFSGITRKAMPTAQTMPTEAAATIHNLQFPRALALLESARKIVGQSTFLKAFPGNVNDTAEPALDPSLRRLTMLYYPRSKSSFSASERLSPSLFLWETLRYSVISTEIASRDRMSSYSTQSKSCLESLRSELNSSSGFILSLLFRVSHSARVLNRREVLLRFEGIQLLAGSICSGISGDKDLLDATKRKGTSLPMVDPESEGEIFPDIQFWKQCADPILAQDPFSSLMSALFCLPVEVLTSTEFFIPIVHLFYIVCVIQALITCYREEAFDRSNFRNCLLNDVCQEMSGYDIAREYFVSKHIDPSCDPKDMVRRLTHPYLRRCALLWELLKSSSSAPLYDSSNIWEGSHLHLDSSTAEGNSSLAIELDGIRELEHLFQIQPLDLILKDECVHMLALRWSQHFCEDYRSRKYRGILFSTPAVPFRLMQLPPVYQVLLERYVKMQCPDCGSVPDEPALCLLCGKLCSPSWKPCCRAGKCLNHASQCGAGVGIFLLVRKTTILLQRSARLAFWPSLYLDAFGEEDHEMHRGKPLYLSQERYAALTYLVASHSLDRTSEVLRQTTISFYTSD
ncbi:E3 ubiquitin-protein ligase PRT6-like [Triticum urartu]|uniref:E3 ubiquitin-protein ligase n=2 Tax=Triticum urartu TaxID=4572 RepID=A0A8R7TSC7_TRIUA|nr:E3 ubiquitin-protein ligase PRT6-like [Triticum urartu]XP_048561723.1 E3 ubiquitin-protein ligase PRT6-like [Triticum urartu]XP_048561724.1 E3 ubiquitin-protein ligase PRT6-like [Triticum urartu]XP_048561725.1 E3 ubiquitin-protein ligase PRT6-like [Triticum urartu]XP_048561726.1 E3 ubiquitin-protein ligase PRT6-like [Triticum urartu]XP_048561727.1 E3 ubiquitin-protein ligase PRT6-like [Triticum urartu]XP_048561728.1 E3 ubiquitin-protein ligase PRT6-like [Triticum urartu]XP_048561729.1 E3 